MSLRLQLLAFGLLTLVLPWTAFRYVREMEATLRSGLESSLLARATTVAAALEGQSVSLCAQPHCPAPQNGDAVTIYAEPLDAEPRIDGARDDWNVAEDNAVVLAGGQRLWAGVFGRYVYVAAAVTDRDIVYQREPGKMPYGDRLVLATEPAAGEIRWLLLTTGAPGVFRAQETAPDAFVPTESYDGRVLAAWLETSSGFSVEARLPLNLVGAALGVGVIDVDRAGPDYSVDLSATWDSATTVPGPFLYQRPELQRVLEQFSRAGGHFRVLDSDGWVLSDAGEIETRPSATVRTSLVSELFRAALRREDPPYPAERPPGRLGDETLRRALTGTPATAWFGGGADRDAIVAAAVPIMGPLGTQGAVLLEQASNPILTLTDQALVRLLALTVLAMVIVGVGLLGYATWLSLRVQRLAHAAETALGPQGEIRVGIPGARAADELGDLARSFAHLLERLREHTEYLRTLASKLSHELRTPLAVVTTSLDNLEHETVAPGAQAYLDRLRQGAQRLDAILAAMSEASQLEQAINETAAERFELGALVEGCCQSYRDVYPDREFACRVESRASAVVGSRELMAQLLDKLVDNAVSFSAAGSRIDVELADSGAELELRVTNRGPLLPAKMRNQLFDSLVSIRDRRDGRPHLGLGLHIVALIAKFHAGRAEAADLPDGSGVVFRVQLPRSPV